jgi:hypothetical protein
MEWWFGKAGALSLDVTAARDIAASDFETEIRKEI